MAEKLEKLLEIKDLKVYFKTDKGILKAVDGVSFDLDKKETLGLVGESGCGKSVTAFSIMRLHDENITMVDGKIYLEGKDLFGLTKEEMRKIRGKEISMIFQNPTASLNPVFTIGSQLVETIRLHQKVSKKEAKERALEMLRKVNIPSPEKRYNEYPHQLSGGMCQRVMIAMALSCNPKLLIADEPTTALDVTIQAQILDLMNNLKEGIDTSIIMITHNMGVVAEIADKVAVMYAGKIMEYGKKYDIFKEPKHPYTIGLFESIPKSGQERLNPIPGSVPNPLNLPEGCAFHPRCRYKSEKCEKECPPLFNAGNQKVRCWLYGN